MEKVSVEVRLNAIVNAKFDELKAELDKWFNEAAEAVRRATYQPDFARFDAKQADPISVVME